MPPVSSRTVVIDNAEIRYMMNRADSRGAMPACIIGFEA